MNQSFKGKGFGLKEWTVLDDKIVVGNKEYLYSELNSFNLVSTPTTGLTNGVIQTLVGGKVLTLSFAYAQKDDAHRVVEFVNNKIDLAHGVVKDYKYVLVSHTGTKLEVYDDYLILYHMQVGSLTQNIMRGGRNGGKRINFSDITSVQFKEPAGVSAGFIQFSYPGSVDSRGGVVGAVNDENSIVIRPDLVPQAREVLDFIEKKRLELKNNSGGTVVQQLSSADEIKKYKELMDAGIISEEEFEAKKKQLLGL